MNGYFCTYFDHWYLTRGLALARSLQAHRPGSHLWVLCLTDLCFEVLRHLSPEGVHPLRLHDLELADPELAATRRNRSILEYYFTCTPALPLYLLEKKIDTDPVTYLDADLFFFANPQPLLDQLDGNSVAIVPHRFPDHLRQLERHGVYNVGWLTFRGDERGLACLRWWRERCIEWCYDRVEPGRFAEQKYLDDWPVRFPGIMVLEHPGANLAPWNLGNHHLTTDAGAVLVDGQRLIFYHAHGLRHGGGSDWDPGLEPYGATLSSVLAEHVYGPHLRALDRERSEVDRVFDGARSGTLPFGPTAKGELADYDRALPEREVARLARQSTVQRLSECERDRVDRLNQIHRLGADLATVDSDRRARLMVIEQLGRQLADAEADRAARLDEIQRLGQLLAESDADRDARLREIQRLGTRLAEADEDRTARLKIIEQLTDQLAASEAGRLAFSERTQQHSGRLAEVEAALASQAPDVRRLSQQVLNLETELSAIKGSRSWRWTAALRLLARGTKRP